MSLVDLNWEQTVDVLTFTPIDAASVVGTHYGWLLFFYEEHRVANCEES